MRSLLSTIVAIIFMASMIGTAQAYVGPGAGLSLVGAFWGLLVAVAAALGFLLLWPLRRLMRRRASARTTPPPAAPDAPDAVSPGARSRAP